LPLSKWFRVILEIVRHKNEVSILSLQNNLVLCYKTVWFMLHNLRRAHEINVISKDKEALANVHLFISLFRRWILGTHQGQYHENTLNITWMSTFLGSIEGNLQSVVCSFLG
jgi:hypothetical protein